MKLSGNSELDRLLLRLREQRQRRAKRFAVLRWVLRVDYYPTQEAARLALAQVPVPRRAGLVDRRTGETWSRKADFRHVVDALRRQEYTAPERFRHSGAIGSLRRKGR